MKLATSTCDFTVACKTHLERIEHVAAAGFRHIDLSMYRMADMDEFSGDDWKSRALALKKEAEARGLDFVQAHSPGGNPLGEDAEKLTQATIRSIEVCGVLGIPMTVVHSGLCGAVSMEEYNERNLVFYKKLFPVMEETGVQVCIENTTKANMGKNTFFLTGKDMADFCRFSGHPLMKGCWDTGHANIEGHQYSDLMDMGEYLAAIHSNDNRGYVDEHIFPLTGTFAADEILHGLIDCGFRGPFTFECDSTLLRPGSWPFSRRVYEGDDRLAMPPLWLRDGFEKLMYETGKWILESYDIPVE